MLKWYYRIITFGLLAAAIGLPFFIKNKQGEPMMSLPSVSDLKPTSSADQTFYKWQDNSGQWSYGDTPPPGVKAVPVTVNTQANVIQSVAVPKDAAEPDTTATITPAAPAYTPPKPGEDILTLERAQNLIKDAHAVNGLMDQHNKQIEAAARGK